MIRCCVVSALIFCMGCGLLDGSRDAREVAIVFDGDAIPRTGDPVLLREARIVGDQLNLSVVYRGGCGGHRFELHGTPAFALSMPPQSDLYLCHDAQGDTCGVRVGETLAFNLAPLKVVWREVHNYTGVVRIKIYEAGATDPAVALSTEVR